MADNYLYETFTAQAGEFDGKFTDYLNQKSVDQWKVKDCSYCHDTENQKTYASCLFKRKS